MTENWKNDLIQVYVPKTGGGGYIATGYPVYHNRILTTRHVFFHSDCCEPGCAMIRWYYRNGVAREWRYINGLAWSGREDVDAALIDCVFPDNWRAYAMMSDAPPYGTAKWESEGFAKEGALEGTDIEAPVPLQGEVYSAADEALTFTVGVANASKLSRPWEGASGSPVVCGREITGVIARCPTPFAGERLHAVPIWKLLEDDGFRQEVGYVPPEKRPISLDALKRRLRKQLARSSLALAELCTTFDCEGAGDDGRAEAVVEAFFDQKVGKFIPNAKRAFKSLLAAGESAAAHAIRHTVLDVFPALFDDRRLVEAVRGRKGEVAFGLLELPVSTPTVAEVVMAAADGRSAAFTKDEKDRPVLRGRFSIQIPPQFGFTRGADQFKKDFDSHLFKEYGLGRRVDKGTRVEAVRTVAEKLERWSESGETRYFVVDVPATEPERKLVRDAIQGLKDDFPALVFLAIDRGDWSILRSQNTIFDPFEDIVGAEIPEEE